MNSSKFQRSIAVIIGINSYQGGIPALSTPLNDAKTLAQILQKQHDYTSYLVVDQAATRENLILLLEKTLPAQVHSGDRLLFYFAGHGIAINAEDGAGDGPGDGPAGYLIPQDATLGDTRTYLSMSRVHDALVKLPCRHFIGILDCCFAGSFRWSSTRKVIPAGPGVLHKERFDRFVQAPAWQMITSAAYDQTAFDAFDLKGHRREEAGQHSPFAAALIEALEGKADLYPPAEPRKLAGDGVTTATELYLYLRDRVEISTEARATRQTPGIHPLKKHDKGEYIFLTPGHPLNLPPAPPLDVSKNPYRGLEAFQEDHRKLFFGREKLLKKLLNFVQAQPLTVVLGASGSGKSSLVRAGLIPELKQMTATQWHVLSPIRPGESPFEALNSALMAAHLPAVDPFAGLPTDASADPQNPQKTLAQSVTAWQKKYSSAHLLIFIDQTEELVTLCADESVRQAFFHQILSAVKLHRQHLSVVLTLRSDFEPQIRDTGLALTPEIFSQQGQMTMKSRWQEGRFIVPAMTRSELREAIEKPAEARVMYFDPPGLVEQLVEEVADMPGALPLLSFALSELYLKYLKRQQQACHRGETVERSLTQADYQLLGGVIQSLTQRADEEYHLLSSKHADYGLVVRHLLLRMVAINGSELARRRVPLAELVYLSEKNVLVQRAIAHFSQARLLVEGQDANGQAYVEPAHDALVRGWQKLQSWISQEKNLALQRRLTVAANEWYRQQHKKYLWTNNPYLDVLKTAVLESADNNWLNQLETKFVQQSLTYRRRESIIRWSLVNTAVLLLSGVAGLATIYAVAAQNRFLEATSLSAKSTFDLENELDAMEQAVEAGLLMAEMPKFFVSQQARTQVTHALQMTLYGIRERNRFDSEQVALSVDFSAENRLIATGLENGTVALWTSDLEGKPPLALTHGTDEVFAVKFVNAGKTLVSASKAQGIKIWQRQSNNLFTLQQEITTEENIMSVAVSEQAKTIASTSMKSDIITLWDLEGNLVKHLKHSRHSDRINGLDFSPSGRMLVTGSADATVKVWDLEGSQPVKTIEADKRILSLVFIDEHTVAIGTTEGTVETLNISNGSGEDFGGRHSGNVHSLAISADAQRLVSVSENSELKVWQIESKQLIETVQGYGEEMTAAIFAHTNSSVISTSTDSSIRLWEMERGAGSIAGTEPRFSADSKMIATAQAHAIYLQRPDGTEQRQLLTHKEDVTEISFSQEGNLIASADAGGTIKISDLAGTALASWQGHSESIVSLRFSPDGKTVFSASRDKTAKLWNLKGELVEDDIVIDSAFTSAEFSPDGKVVALASRDRRLRILRLDDWSYHSKDPVEAAIVDISFSADGRTIASASENGFIYLWNPERALPIKSFRADREGVNAVAFMPDNNSLVSAGTDSVVKQWTLDGDLLMDLYRHESVSSLVISPDGKTLASASYLDVTVRSLAVEALAKSGCQWLHDFHQANPKEDLTPCLQQYKNNRH